MEGFDKICTRYKIEISAEKTKQMTNSVHGIQTEIKVNGQKLGTGRSFKCLGAGVSDNGFKPEITKVTAHLTKVKTKLER